MNRTTKNIALFLILISISCNQQKSNNSISTESELSERLSNIDSILIDNPTTTDYFVSTFTKKLSDSVELNKSYNYKFDFNAVIDKNKIRDEIFFFIYLTTENGEFNTIKEIKKVNHHAFVLDKRGILEFNFKFKNSGMQILSVIIEDVEFLESKQKSDSIPLRKIETSFRKEIFVR